MRQEFNSAPVLVTGGTGMIGTALCRRLAHSGADVHAVARHQRVAPDSDITLHIGDMGDSASATRIVREVQPRYVVDLAATVQGSQDLSLARSIYFGTLAPSVNLATALCELKDVARLVFVGSFIMKPGEDGVAPCPYGAAKQSGEAYLRTCSLLYDLPIVYINPSYVYGPGPSDPKRIIPYLITTLLRGETARIGSGQRITDWLFVDDCAEALEIALARDGVEGANIDIGSGRGASVIELARHLESTIAGTGNIEVGAVSDRMAEDARIVEPEYAFDMLGWRAGTSLEDGLERTIEYWDQRLHS